MHKHHYLGKKRKPAHIQDISDEESAVVKWFDLSFGEEEGMRT